MTFISGNLDTTIRLKWSLGSRPDLTDTTSISGALRQFGTVDSSDILVSLKPSPPKKPKRGTAVIPFRQVGDAFAAVCASGREDLGLKDVEISWAEGKEPPLIEWLKKMGKLGSQEQNPDSSSTFPASPASPPDSNAATSEEKSSSAPFSSFPSTFVSCLCSLAFAPAAHTTY